MDHTFSTTAGVNRRSSHVQINEAIEQCRISIMKEYHATGFVGNWKPKSFDEALHIATGLAVEDARRRCGAVVPLFVWDKRYIPEVYQKQNKIPFHFVDDVTFKKQVEADEEKMSWKLLGDKELVQKVEKEEAEEAGEAALIEGEEEDPELAELERIQAEAEGNLVKVGSSPDIVVVDPTKNPDGSMSASEKIRLGLKDRKYAGEPPPEDRRKARLEALRAKDPAELTPSESVELGMAEVEYPK